LAFLLSLAIVFPHAKRTYPWFCELVVGYHKQSDNRKRRGVTCPLLALGGHAGEPLSRQLSGE
jgi:hypothetical protein